MGSGELLVVHTVERGDRDGSLRAGAHEHRAIGQASQCGETELERSRLVLHHHVERWRQRVGVDCRDKHRMRPRLWSRNVAKRSLAKARPKP